MKRMKKEKMNMQRCRKPEGFKGYREHYNHGN